MNPDTKVIWVAALRSGDYKQITGQLRGGYDVCYAGHCCLGVLCEVEGMKYNAHGVFVDDALEPSYEPLEDMIGRDNTVLLWEKNDSGSTFAEIADYIEANL
jgi:hypothetical protein